jgi:hypothetical protein
MTAPAAIWELTCARVGPDRGTRIAYYVDQGEAEYAANEAQANGFCTRLAPIPLPLNGKGLADLLTDLAARFGLAGGGR